MASHPIVFGSICGLIVHCGALCLGCASSQPELLLLRGQVLVKKYSDVNAGVLECEIELSTKQDLLNALNRWLSEPHSKQISWTSFVPKLVVQSDQTKINFVKDTVVLSVRKTPTDVWTQYTWSGDEKADKLRKQLLNLFQLQSEK